VQHVICEVNTLVPRDVLVAAVGTKCTACGTPEIALISVHRATLLCPTIEHNKQGQGHTTNTFECKPHIRILPAKHLLGCPLRLPPCGILWVAQK